MPHFTLMVLSNPVEGREQDYNDWYTHQHLPDVLRVPGMVAAERFRMVGTPLGEGGAQYCAFYEMEHDRPEDVLAQLVERAGTDQMPMSDAMAPGWSAVLYESIARLTIAEIDDPALSN